MAINMAYKEPLGNWYLQREKVRGGLGLVPQPVKKDKLGWERAGLGSKVPPIPPSPD